MSSPSLHRNKQLLHVSRFKALQKWARPALSCVVSREWSRGAVIQNFLEVDFLLELRIPPFSIGAIRRLGDFIPSRPLFILQASSASAGLVTAISAPVPAWWSPVKDQPCTPRAFTGSGSAPTAPMEPLYRSGQKEVHQHYWPEERDVAARLVTSRSGRASRPGDPRPNPQGARADLPYLLLSTCACANNSTPRRETCKDKRARPPRMRSLRSDQPRARTVYCAVGVYPTVRNLAIKAVTTGADGAGPWECTAGATPAPTRTRDR